MNAATPELTGQCVILLATVMIVLQLLMVVQRMLVANIRLFALQSLMLAIIALLVAFRYGAHDVFVAAALTLIGKVAVFPWFLVRLVRQIKITQEVEPLLNPSAAMLTCGGLILLGYLVARPFNSSEYPINGALGVAIGHCLTGIFMMINRRKAITQVLALLSAENGVFLAAIALTSYGMPLVVELGIFFDVFVAVMILGILVYRIRETFASIDVGRLNRLKG